MFGTGRVKVMRWMRIRTGEKVDDVGEGEGWLVQVEILCLGACWARVPFGACGHRRSSCLYMCLGMAYELS
jgi:hypothetical protein